MDTAFTDQYGSIPSKEARRGDHLSKVLVGTLALYHNQQPGKTKTLIEDMLHTMIHEYKERALTLSFYNMHDNAGDDITAWPDEYIIRLHELTHELLKDSMYNAVNTNDIDVLRIMHEELKARNLVHCS